MPGVATSGGIDSGATVVVGAELTLGDRGRTVTDGATVAGAVDDPGARVATGVVTPEETVTAADDSGVDVEDVAIVDSLSGGSTVETSGLATELSGVVEVVESPDRFKLHTTIAIPIRSMTAERGRIIFRAIAGKYQKFRDPNSRPLTSPIPPKSLEP